ncbi:MAG: hypothetical protein SGPRY_012261 [Prymnesium sp.]
MGREVIDILDDIEEPSSSDDSSASEQGGARGRGVQARGAALEKRAEATGGGGQFAHVGAPPGLERRGVAPDAPTPTGGCGERGRVLERGSEGWRAMEALNVRFPNFTSLAMLKARGVISRVDYVGQFEDCPHTSDISWAGERGKRQQASGDENGKPKEAWRSRNGRKVYFDKSGKRLSGKQAYSQSQKDKVRAVISLANTSEEFNSMTMDLLYPSFVDNHNGIVVV